jgi:glycosyltransferase involved in cell wall biosynthesis
VPVVAISHHQAGTAGAIPIAAVIHHGVDVDAIPAGAGDGGFALFLGRMNPDKGVHTAVEVARRASTPLVIAAKMREPAEREYFEAFVRPLLGEGAAYAGEVDTETKRKLLAEARCLLNPIAWPEPFGMVVVESLAAGTPVVATPLGAIPELVDDGVTGFLRTSLDDLAAAVDEAGTLDRAACRRAAETRFSHRRMAADHVALYERLLA